MSDDDKTPQDAAEAAAPSPAEDAASEEASSAPEPAKEATPAAESAASDETQAPKPEVATPEASPSVPSKASASAEANPSKAPSASEAPSASAASSAPETRSSPAGAELQDNGWRALLPLLAIIGVLFLYLLFNRPAPRVEEEARVDASSARVLLVNKAPNLVVRVDGAWRLTPLSQDMKVDAETKPTDVSGELSFDAAAWTVSVDGATHALPPSGVVELGPVGADPEEPAPVFGIEQRRYRGVLWVKRSEGGLLHAINRVSMEDYLAGVLGHEMPLSWSDEALKVQAIASRSYAVFELKPKRPFDLQSDTRSQVYRGVVEGQDKRARMIVYSTRGLVLKHQGKVVHAYFHSTCGGDTVPAVWTLGTGEDTPPLRGAPDCRCQASRLYRWEKTVDLKALNEKRPLKVELPLKAFEIEHWPRAEYVRTVTITGKNGAKRSWGGYRARSFFGLKAPSFNAVLSDDGLTLAVKGRGWGHGVGMCQYGAEGFSKQGWKAEKILKHFYPETTIEPLE